MITGIHHVSIIASSEESIAFYSKFGFTEYKRVERKGEIVQCILYLSSSS